MFQSPSKGRWDEQTLHNKSSLFDNVIIQTFTFESPARLYGNRNKLFASNEKHLKENNHVIFDIVSV